MTYTLPSTDSQLLCACGVSYAIGTNNPLTTAPYYDGAAFLDTPEVIHGILPQTAACIVGQIAGYIVIAFRGTALTEVNDWSTDLMAEPVKTKEFPGSVHSGFYLSVMEIMPKIMLSINKLVTANPGQPLLITGHSKGAAMASLAAWYLNTHLTSPPEIRVTAFAAPMTGDKVFARAYMGDLLNEKFYQKNYINYLDIVPFLPPSKDVANELINYIDSLKNALPAPFGSIITGILKSFSKWEYARVASKEEYILHPDKTQLNYRISDGSFNMPVFMDAIKDNLEEGNIQAILAAHSHVCGGGYMSAVCPAIPVPLIESFS